MLGSSRGGPAEPAGDRQIAHLRVRAASTSIHQPHGRRTWAEAMRGPHRARPPRPPRSAARRSVHRRPVLPVRNRTLLRLHDSAPLASSGPAARRLDLPSSDRSARRPGPHRAGQARRVDAPGRRRAGEGAHPRHTRGTRRAPHPRPARRPGARTPRRSGERIPLPKAPARRSRGVRRGDRRQALTPAACRRGRVLRDRPLDRRNPAGHVRGVRAPQAPMQPAQARRPGHRRRTATGHACRLQAAQLLQGLRDPSRLGAPPAPRREDRPARPAVRRGRMARNRIAATARRRPPRATTVRSPRHAGDRPQSSWGPAGNQRPDPRAPTPARRGRARGLLHLGPSLGPRRLHGRRRAAHATRPATTQTPPRPLRRCPVGMQLRRCGTSG